MQEIGLLIKAIADRASAELVAGVLFGLLAAMIIFVLLRMMAKRDARQSILLEQSIRVETFMQAALDANTAATNANTVVMQSIVAQQQVNNQRLQDLVAQITKDRK